MTSDTGQRPWSFQTDGGVTTTATTFEHEGVQYLAGIAVVDPCRDGAVGGGWDFDAGVWELVWRRRVA
jgi:hypothetical protein